MTDTTETAERWMVYTSIDDLPPAPRNPKQHQRRELGRSFRRFGYLEPVILDERTGRLVAGHGRVDELRAARRRTPQQPPEGVRLLEDGRWAVPVVRGWSSKDDDEAEAALLVQHIGEGMWDGDLLGDVLGTLIDTPEGLEGTGYDEDFLAGLLSEADPMAALDEENEDADTSPQLRAMTYRIVVHVQGEIAQRELLERLLGEGYDARAVLT